MTLRLAAVVFCALAVPAGRVVQGPGASAGSDAGRQADLTGIEKLHQHWRQLTFIRMFGTAAIGLGAICLWSHGHLTALQQASFLKLLVGVLAAMCLMAVSQQTAIWGAGAGWALVGVLGATALACLAALARTATRQAV